TFEQYVKDYQKTILTPFAYESIGMSMEEQGNNNGALEAYNKLINKYPEHFIVPAVYMSIGRVLTSMGEEESAKKQYQKILDFHTNSAWVSKAKERIEGPKEEETPPASPQIEIKPEAKKEEAPEEEKPKEAAEKAPEVQPQEAESTEEKAE
ncbi:MAG: tetratricopeptide repeat protein, partial [bacterium]